MTITKDSTVIILTIGADTATVNGESIKLDAAPFIQNYRTYTPIRFISEGLGASVGWNGETQTGTITQSNNE